MELKVAQDLLAGPKQDLILLKADVEKTQEVVKLEAAKDEAARHQHQAELNSQEEDLATREKALAATLPDKDEEVEKLVAQQT